MKKQRKKNKKNAFRKIVNYLDSKKGFSLFELILIVLITIVLSSVITGSLVYNNYSKLNKGGSDKYLNEFNVTYNSILNKYVNKIDKNKLIESAINGMFEYIGDPNSSYLNDEETKYLNYKLNGTYEGVGIEVVDSKDGIVINRVFHDTPAYKAGIKKGDIVLKINNKDVSKKTGQYLASYIKEKINGKFKLTIKRDGKEKVFELEKTKIDYPVVYTDIFDKTGYIYLSSFSESSSKQFKDSLKDLEKEKIDNLVIDLRQNTGGYLDEAYKISDLFLVKGKTSYQLRTNSDKSKIKSKDSIHRIYDMVVLIDGESASASEVLTLSLKENIPYVTVVGEKSFGKGTVQQAKELKDGNILKYTTAKWLSPKGKSIDGKGIKPDIEIKYEDDDNEIDNQLRKALDVLQ